MKRHLLFLFVLLLLLSGLTVTFTKVAHAEPGVAHLSSSCVTPGATYVKTGTLGVANYWATSKAGSPQRFSTALLVKGCIRNKLILPSHAKWIEEELQRFSGNLVAFEILPNNGPPIKAVSVYGPAWSLDRQRLSERDLTEVRLTQNRDVWVMDLLWTSLKYQRSDLDQPWIIAGDFNLSETFDLWPGGPRGNREYLDRMRELDLIECLRQSKGRLTPTFRNPSGGLFKH
jgi:hypothetical protein